MEKSERRRTNELAQEDLQSPKEFEDGKVDSDDLHPNRQLQKNTEPAQNAVKNDFKTPTESGATDCGSQDQHLIERKRKLRKIIDDYYKKQNQGVVKQTTENPEKILIPQAQDSIPTAEHVSNVGSEELWEEIATNKHLETNAAIQEKSDLQRQSSILSSTKGLQQPCEVLVENVRVRREQDIMMQQETATQDKVLEIPTKSGAAQYDSQEQELIEREQTRRKILADFFNKQNQVTEPQRTDSPGKILFAPVQDSIPTAEYDLIDAAYEELDRIDKKERIATNAILQKRTDLPRKSSMSNTKKEGLWQPCEVSEKSGKVKEQEIVMQQKSEILDNDTKTKAETVSQNHELMQWENDLRILLKRYFDIRNMIAHYFNKQNQVTIPQRNDSSKEILIGPSEDSIPTAERELNDGAQQEWDRIAKKERLETNATLQQRSEQQPRKLSILSSKEETLQQLFEVVEERVKVTEQDIVIQEKNAITDNDTKILAETDTQNQELMQRENVLMIIIREYFEMRSMLAHYFNKRNQVTIPQRGKSSKEILIAPSEDSIPAAESDLDDVAQQEWDKIAKKEGFGKKVSLQPRSELPRKLSKLSLKEGLHQPCKISNQTVKIRGEQDKVLQQKSATPDNDSKTLSETDTQRQELMHLEQ